MWIYLLVAITFVYVLYKERQALGCPTVPNGQDCDNANGKAIKGTNPLPSDPTSVIFEKIRKAADFADRWVVWRLSYILALPTILLIYFFLYQRIPKEHELVISLFVITTVVYFTLNFYKFHLIDHAKNNIDEGVKILESRVG